MVKNAPYCNTKDRGFGEFKKKMILGERLSKNAFISFINYFTVCLVLHNIIRGEDYDGNSSYAIRTEILDVGHRNGIIPVTSLHQLNK